MRTSCYGFVFQCIFNRLNVCFVRFLAKKDFCILHLIFWVCFCMRMKSMFWTALCWLKNEGKNVLAVVSQAEESNLLASSKPLLIPSIRALHRRRHGASCWMLLNWIYVRSAVNIPDISLRRILNEFVSTDHFSN